MEQAVSTLGWERIGSDPSLHIGFDYLIRTDTAHTEIGFRARSDLELVENEQFNIAPIQRVIAQHTFDPTKFRWSSIARIEFQTIELTPEESVAGNQFLA